MKQELVKLLSQLVSIPSTYPKEFLLGKYLFNFLRDRKYKVTKQFVENRRFNVIAEKGKGEKTILLYSHLDTVAEAQGWKTNPFIFTKTGDRGYGLGAWDMKGGMTTNILTFLNFQPKNFKLKLVLCVDEENISKGGYKFINSTLSGDIDCVISSEPAFQYGLRGIVTGRVGRAVYEITIKRPSTHFAFYESKIDTNLLAGEMLIQLSKFFKQKKDRKQFMFARKISSEAIGMSLPQETKIEIDSAIIPPTSHKEIQKNLIFIVKKLSKKYRGFIIDIKPYKRETPFLEGYEIDEKNKYLFLLKTSVVDEVHKQPIPYFRSSLADENVFGSRGITVLGVGPEGGNAHSANEWVSITSLEKLYNIINNFLTKVDNKI